MKTKSKGKLPYIIFSFILFFQIPFTGFCQISPTDPISNEQIADMEEYEEVLQEQQQLIQAALFTADSLRDIDDFEAAILILEELRNQSFIERDEWFDERLEVENRIDILKKEYSAQQFNSHVQLAEKAFSKEKYAEAKEHLLAAQQIDPSSQNVLDKLKEIGRIESLLAIREDSLFNYSLYNKPVGNAIQAAIFKKMKNYIKSMSAGDIHLSYTLKTDLTGENRSYFQINSFLLFPPPKYDYLIDTQENLELFLDSLIIAPSIPAVKIERLLVNAATTYENQASWKSTSNKITYGGKNLKVSLHHFTRNEKNALKEYFSSNSSLPIGSYTIDKKELMYQDTLHTAMVLKKFYTVGPEAAAYSMLLPGAGSLAATHGKKGWGALTSFIIFTGAGTSVFLLAKQMKPGKTQDIVKYVAYGSFGISGVIYIADVFVALKRGMDNLKKARVLQAKLNENNIYIQKFPPQFDR